MKDRPISALIVEDDPSSAEALAETLALHGIAPTVLPDAEQALRQIPGLAPDIILVDLRLAGPMSGLDLLLSLGSNGHAPSIPALAISAFMDEQMAHDLRRDGFAACFPKPFDAEKVIAAIHTLVGG